MKTPVLETERLILRPLTTEDAPAVFQWAGDERVTRYMTYPTHSDISATLEWLESLDHENDTEYEFGFVEKESGELIGSGGVYWNEGLKQWRIGYNLRFSSWGKGFATEAAREIVRFAKEELAVDSIGVCHAVDNPNSGRVIEKCDFVFTEYGEYSKIDNSATFKSKEYIWTKNSGK